MVELDFDSMKLGFAVALVLGVVLFFVSSFISSRFMDYSFEPYYLLPAAVYLLLAFGFAYKRSWRLLAGAVVGTSLYYILVSILIVLSELMLSILNEG